MELFFFYIDTLAQTFSVLTLPWFVLRLTVVANNVFCMLLVHLECCTEIWCCGPPRQVTRLSQLVQQNVLLKKILQCSHFMYYSFFSPGATTPIGGCILQPSSGL